MEPVATSLHKAASVPLRVPTDANGRGGGIDPSASATYRVVARDRAGNAFACRQGLQLDEAIDTAMRWYSISHIPVEVVPWS